MDMQGIPIGSTSKGMKASNTTDPRAKHEIQEGTGAIASDSLAAESSRAGGGFSENRNSEPLAVKGANSTFANEDISGATTLSASKDGPSRKDENDSPSGPGGAKYAEAPSGGQPSFPGTAGDEGYSGDSSAAKQAVSGNSGTNSTSKGESSGDSKGHSSGTSEETSTGGTKGSSSGENEGAPTGNSEEPHVDPAPTYVQNVITHHGSDKDKPKGKNLTEGFEDDGNNASLDMQGEPGDENDPGRAGVKQFEATTSATIGSGPTQKGASGGSQYKTLDGDESLE